jgi:hypothetical protein
MVRCDWSSDVCSSDLHGLLFIQKQTCHKDRSPAIRHPPTCPVATQASGFNPIPIDKRETYFNGLLTENRERFLGDQEIELEDMNEIEMDKINLDLEIVKMTIKSLKSNTSCGVGGVPAELLKSGTENVEMEEYLQSY